MAGTVLLERSISLEVLDGTAEPRPTMLVEYYSLCAWFKHFALRAVAYHFVSREVLERSWEARPAAATMMPGSR
jgi:hypothetical protein